ncbi:MAG: rhodanese-like domain-containing protein [Phycisphaeraceae bacterium]|nr:rhodanese-like domain-containing protein [Phycisphaeraceae bacterium]
MPITDVAPELLESWMQSGDTVLIDVREDFEHAEERIAGAVPRPLSKFDPDAIRRESGGKRVVFHCRSGKRSLDAATRYQRDGAPAFHLSGGIEGWKASSRQVIRSATAPRIPVMRQVQITAGSLVVLSVALGAFVSPWFLALTAFVGCGLVFAGVTGWCGMAMLMAAMPWNKRSRQAVLAASSCAV